jgi:hypothetical protein
MGKAARDAVIVPELSMNAIRLRSKRVGAHNRLTVAIACVAFAAGTLGAAAYGEKAVEGIRIWISGDKSAAVVDSLTMIREPLARQLRAVVAKATFPVVFPVGLPADAQVRSVIFSPAEKPNIFVVMYTRLGNHKVDTFMLVDPAVVNADQLPVGMERPTFRTVKQWRIGGEIVMPGWDAEHWANWSAIRAAMASSSPDASLDALANALPKVVVLGSPARLDVAERLRPAGGPSVLIEPRQIDAILRSAHPQPIVDNRTYTLTHIPYVKGAPDYEKASMAFSKDVLASANGARAIEAAVRLAGGAACSCYVLVHQPDAATYWVWTIPATGAAPPRKFVVDAKTLTARPASN